jgi:hypothetical protein
MAVFVIRTTAMVLKEGALCPSVDRAKPAIYRHFKTGHFRLAAEAE